MKFGKSFTYNGKNTASDFGLVLVSLKSDSNSVSLGLDREVEKGSTTKYRESANHYGARYSDVLTYQITLIKNEEKYFNQRDMKFNRTELRKLTSWLTSNRLPKLLEIEENVGEDEKVDFFGIFTKIEPVALEHDLYGIKLTFQCDSQYGYSKEYNYVCNGNDTTIIENTSDEIELPVYPMIKIVPKSTGKIKISNLTEEKSFEIECQNMNDIHIDCKNTMIYNTKAQIFKLSDIGLTYNQLDKFYWFRLLHGINEIKVDGDAEVTITCRYPRKVGEF